MKRLKRSLKVLAVLFVLILAFQAVALGAPDIGVTGYFLETGDGELAYFNTADLFESYYAWEANPGSVGALMYKRYLGLREPTDGSPPAMPAGYEVRGVEGIVSETTLMQVYQAFKADDVSYPDPVATFVQVLTTLKTLQEDTTGTNPLATLVKETVKNVVADDAGNPITITIVGSDGTDAGTVTVDETGTVVTDTPAITTINIPALTVPAEGGKVQTTITGVEGVNIFVAWTDSNNEDATITGTFEVGQAPKASLTITPTFGNSFDEGVTITYGGTEIQAAGSGNLYTYAKQFNEIVAKGPAAGPTFGDVKLIKDQAGATELFGSLATDNTSVWYWDTTIDPHPQWLAVKYTVNDAIVVTGFEVYKDDGTTAVYKEEGLTITKDGDSFGFVGFDATQLTPSANDFPYGTYKFVLNYTLNGTAGTTEATITLTAPADPVYSIEYEAGTTAEQFYINLLRDGEKVEEKAILWIWAGMDEWWLVRNISNTGVLSANPTTEYFLVDGAKYLLIIGEDTATTTHPLHIALSNNANGGNPNYVDTLSEAEKENVFFGTLDM